MHTSYTKDALTPFGISTAIGGITVWVRPKEIPIFSLIIGWFGAGGRASRGRQPELDDDNIIELKKTKSWTQVAKHLSAEAGCNISVNTARQRHRRALARRKAGPRFTADDLRNI